jgi:hypothetical protein
MLPVCAFKIVPGVLRTKERCPSAESQPPEKYMNTVLTTIFFATWSIEAIRVHGGPPLCETYLLPVLHQFRHFHHATTKHTFKMNYKM